jgi:hypothetical protein
VSDKQTHIWTAGALVRHRLRTALRYAGVRFTEEKGFLSSRFTITGNEAQLRLAIAAYEYMNN